MRAKHVLFLILAITFASCGEDRRKEFEGRTAPNRWIEAEMRENYYWYEDMPAYKTLNFFGPTQEFFSKLLSSKDGKNNTPYSWLEEVGSRQTDVTRSTSEDSYGMEIVLYKNPITPAEFYARVLYTVKNSPATAAGVLRGDWIFSVNGQPITADNTQDLLSGSGVVLETGYLTEDQTPEVTEIKTITSSREIQNNPVYYHNIYESNGRKVGYLVYNLFISGEGDSDTRYLTELSNLSNEFKAANVTDFILDLRYNPGGELNRPVPLLCSMLSSPAAMGNLMGYVEYNDKNRRKDWSITFSESNLMGGSNLGLNRVFIITGMHTASASEAVVNFLDPYMDVILVGTRTEGKNVGSEQAESDEFENDNFEKLILHPIVCKIYNSQDFSEYEGGFAPKYLVDEMQKSGGFLPLGDPNELLLSTVLSLIDGTYNPGGDDQDNTRMYSNKLKVSGSSLDRKAVPGVIIKPR